MSRPLPFHWGSSKFSSKANREQKARELESIAQLVEDMIPNFKKEEEKQFYLEVAQSYRTAALNLLQKAGHGNRS